MLRVIALSLLVGFGVSFVAFVSSTVFLHRGLAHKAVVFKRPVTETFRLLIWVASRPDQRNTIEQAAEYNGISRHHLMKVAQRLSLAGLLSATRGRGGGLRLARPASEIRVGDVLRVTEPDFNCVGCQRGEPCWVASTTMPEAVWGQVAPRLL